MPIYDFKARSIGTPSQPRINLIRWAAFTIVLLIVIGIVSFWFGRSSFIEGRLKLEVEAPEEITSGQEVVYKVKIENNNEVNLINPKLSFFYPSDSVVLDEQGNVRDVSVVTIDLETLGEDQKIEKEFKAFVIGDRGNIKTARALLSYRPENIKSVFEKQATASTTISQVSVPLSLAVPPNVLSGQNIEITLDYRNEGKEDINNLRIKFDFPAGFSFISVEPAPTLSPNIWEIPALKQGAGSRIKISGAISGQEKEVKVVSATLQKKINNRWVDFQKISGQMTIAKNFLDVGITVNESSSHIAEFGEELEYKIVFKNSSDTAFKALKLEAKLEGTMFNLATIRSNGFFDQASRTIVWNEAVEPKLGNLAPESEGQVSFRVKLRTSPSGTSFSAKDFSIKVRSVLETLQVPPNFDLEKVTAQHEIITKIATQANLSAKAYYNDPDWNINTGPVPPRVGQKTTYTIHWEVGSISSDLSNAKVKSFLPPGVNWENKVKVNFGATQPEYNIGTGEIVWSIPNVPSGTGLKTPNFEAIFQISITPSENQVGQEPLLIKETILTGIDAFTSKTITVSAAQLNTGAVEDNPGNVQQ